MSNAPAPRGVPEWTISDRLRKARELRGWSQVELAKQSAGNLTLRTISNYEKPDHTGARKRSTVSHWALVTGVSFNWLWTGTAPDGDGPEQGDSNSACNDDAEIIPFPLATAA